MNFLMFLAGLLGTVISFFQRLPAPVVPVVPAPTPDNPTPVPDKVATLKAIILSETISIRTKAGGLIHQLNATQAETVAKALADAAERYHLPLSLVAAQVRLESDFDSAAYDENVASSTPGESAEQLFEHTDFGIEQEDGAIANADPSFAALPLADRKAKLLDLNYGVDFLCKTLQENLTWANAAALAEPSLMNAVPNQDVRIPALEAYNTGQHGMAEQLRSGTPNFKYGIKGVAYADKWKPLVG